MQPEAQSLLTWYDSHKRDLPWRAKQHEIIDPYKIWLSEIMLQQTTIATVKAYYAKFLSHFPTLEDLAKAPNEQVMLLWAGLGYYTRARNLHTCAKIIMNEHNGQFPQTYETLIKLPGIGSYTAASVAAIAFNQPEAAVDGNVERVITRVFAIEEKLTKAKPLIQKLTKAMVPVERAGDFAQSLMDLGSTICTPRKPACLLCPWQSFCKANQAGNQESYPRKAPKREKTPRKGAAFVIYRSDGAIMLKTRPEKGLLGGMAEVPTTDWKDAYNIEDALQDAPLNADWVKTAHNVHHVFTHFPLELAVYKTTLPLSAKPLKGYRWASSTDKEPLSKLMLKVIEASKKT